MSPGMSSRAGGTAPSSDSRSGARPSNISPEVRELLPTSKLTDLMQEVAPGESIDADVEEFLQEHIDEFVDSVTEFACMLAKHRKSRTVEARDFQVHLEKKWNIRVPGFGDDPRPPAKRNAAAPVHNARLQAIAKSQAQHHRANPPVPPRPITAHAMGAPSAEQQRQQQQQQQQKQQAAQQQSQLSGGAPAATSALAQTQTQTQTQSPGQGQSQSQGQSQAAVQPSPSQPSPSQPSPSPSQPVASQPGAAAMQVDGLASQTATPSQPQP